jgi:hypothetical protein
MAWDIRDSHEGRYKEYWICVYFNTNGVRVGCDCSVEIGEPGSIEATLKLVVIPEHIRQASLLWSGTEYRHMMQLSEFLSKTLDQ